MSQNLPSQNHFAVPFVSTTDRAGLRNALYMPALVATRFNPDLKELYTRLTKAGKPAKLAITAVMRKLVIIANALLRKGEKWQRKTA